MQKKNTPKAKTNTTKRDPLAPYREQSKRFIKLYFGKDTPEFLHDVLASWYTQLESITQVFWNHKEIAEVALPLMLREAARRGIDVESSKSGLCFEALQESIFMHDRRSCDSFSSCAMSVSPSFVEGNSMKEKLSRRRVE
jgi:hypothetical protein